MSVIPYKNLDSIGRKARDAEKRLSCGNCPHSAFSRYCTDRQRDICDYVYLSGFRSGYNRRKREEKEKRVNNK